MAGEWHAMCESAFKDDGSGGPAGVKSRQLFENCDGNKLQRLFSFRHFTLYDGNYKFAYPVTDKNHPSTISRIITMLDAILKFLIFARFFCTIFVGIFKTYSKIMFI
jgi:hypothetical protein